eukprot:NODE_4418_length_676_cov_237.347826.p2 GENE.NODE_4418_length_676_cov_237.347826~~NODE_4418_length_676_cov_237.347826.p2  ORF type:complete len:77 (+),score=4.72 NODE_4418_length_676_cov_237.347826:227-457(+)
MGLEGRGDNFASGVRDLTGFLRRLLAGSVAPSPACSARGARSYLEPLFGITVLAVPPASSSTQIWVPMGGDRFGYR